MISFTEPSSTDQSLFLNIRGCCRCHTRVERVLSARMPLNSSPFLMAIAIAIYADALSAVC